MKRRRWKPEKDERKQVKLVCLTCSKWFTLPSQCTEVSNANVCDSCLSEESRLICSLLQSRSITLPHLSTSPAN